MLERDPPKRLGCKPHGEGFEELKAHPWFQSIDWATLGTKEQTSPFIPDVRVIFLAFLLPSGHASPVLTACGFSPRRLTLMRHMSSRSCCLRTIP